MQTRITVMTAEYNNGLVSISYHGDNRNVLYRDTKDFQNINDIENFIGYLKSMIKVDSLVLLSPVTRKFKGFDKWETANRKLFEIRG